MGRPGDIFLVGVSALEFWRVRVGAVPDACDERTAGPVPAGVPEPGCLEVLGDRMLARLSAPLDVYVGTASNRRVSDLFSCHVCPTGIPSGAFVRVAHGVYVASPALCFLQFAGSLSLAQTVMLGCELCGRYAFPLDGSDILVDRARPLADVNELARFVQRAVGLRGRRSALQALRYLLPRSASPMETVLGLLLSLPRRYGGFGLPVPELNCRIELDRRARTVSGHDYHVVDFLWRDVGLVGEYDGRSVHAREASFDADRLRSNALKSMGFEVINFTACHIRSDDLLESQAGDVARRIGYRMQAVRGFDARERRLYLRGELLERPEGSAKPVWPGRRTNLPSARAVLDRMRA